MGKEKLSLTELFQNLFGKLSYDSNGACIKGDRLLKVKNKSTSYIVPNTVKVICDEAFSNCKNLTSLEIGESVETIGHRAIPKKISRLIIKNENLRLTGDNFMGMRSSKEKMSVITKMEQKSSIQHSLEEFTKVSSFNERPPLSIGKNESGQELTYVTIEIELKNLGTFLHVTTLTENQVKEKENVEIVLAKNNAPLSIKVFGTNGKIIHDGKDFIVDGNINGGQNGVLSSYPTFNLSKNWEKTWNKEEELVDEYVMRNTFRDLTQEDLFSGLIIRDSSYKFIEVTENNSIRIKFRVRAIDGKFNTSKLNFIKLPNRSRSNNLKEIISDFPYLLNLIVYDNDIYSGEVDQNLKSINISQLIKDFMLTSQFTPETFSTNILEYKSPENKDHGKWWIDEEEN